MCIIKVRLRGLRHFKVLLKEKHDKVCRLNRYKKDSLIHKVFSFSLFTFNVKCSVLFSFLSSKLNHSRLCWRDEFTTPSWGGETVLKRNKRLFESFLSESKLSQKHTICDIGEEERHLRVWESPEWDNKVSDL